MHNKFFQNLMKPYFTASMLLCLVFTVVLLFFHLYVGIGAGILTLAFFFYWKSYAGLHKEDLKAYSEDLLEEIGMTGKHFLEEDPRPLAIMDGEGTILWANGHFAELYDAAEPLRSNVADVAGIRPAEIAEQMENGKYTLVDRKNHTYRLRAYGSGKVTLLYWTDVSALEMLKELYNESRICLINLAVDNYDEIMVNAEDENRAVLAAQVETTIRQWASRYNALVLKPRDNRYFMMLEQHDYERMEEAKFSLLDDIRVIETQAEFPASVSMGIGLGGKTLQENEEYADAALDLALGRGGDQAVVKRRSRIEYYGGRLETVEKRNKGKSRIVAHALRQLIDQADKVFIMGHVNPDMDSFGAAGGIAAFARFRNRDAYIVMDEYDPTLARLVSRADESGLVLVTGDAAAAMATEDSLIVVVDTNRPQMVCCPDLLPLSDKLVLIDHHRKAEDSLEETTLSYLETYASSTSELVTEILQYASDNKKIIEKNEADALMAGIALDTKDFSTRTGVRTFEAASWLRRNGADVQRVHQVFQSSVRDTQMRAAIIAGAEELEGGIVLATCSQRGDDVRVIMAQAADALLAAEGVNASIVVGPAEEEGRAQVSARSNGEINVQALMEKLGGGGHFSMAGAAPEGTVAEVADRIRQLLAETNEENKPSKER